jgi:hypothetical protein
VAIDAIGTRRFYSDHLIVRQLGPTALALVFSIAGSGLHESATRAATIALSGRFSGMVFKICKGFDLLAEPAFSSFFGRVFVQRSGMLIKTLLPIFSSCGEVAEWLKAPASKADVP